MIIADTSREAIVRIAREFIGVKWRHLGRSMTGLDCVGLVTQTGRTLGYEFEEPEVYSREPDGRKLMALIRAQTRPADAANIKPGMVLAFRDNIYPCHIGIATIMHGQPAVIHAAANIGKTLEQTIASMTVALIEARDFPQTEE